MTVLDQTTPMYCTVVQDSLKSSLHMAASILQQVPELDSELSPSVSPRRVRDKAT